MIELIIIFVVSSLSALVYVCFKWLQKASGLQKIPAIFVLVFAGWFYLKLFQLPYFKLILQDFGIAASYQDRRYIVNADPHIIVRNYLRSRSMSVMQAVSHGEEAVSAISEALLQEDVEDYKRAHLIDVLSVIDSPRIDSLLNSYIRLDQPEAVMFAAIEGCTKIRTDQCLASLSDIFLTQSLQPATRRKVLSHMLIWAVKEDKAVKEIERIVQNELWSMDSCLPIFSGFLIHKSDKIVGVADTLLRAYANRPKTADLDIYALARFLEELVRADESSARIPLIISVLDKYSPEEKHDYSISQIDDGVQINFAVDGESLPVRESKTGQIFPLRAGQSTGEIKLGHAIAESGALVIPVLTERLQQASDHLFTGRVVAVALIRMGEPGVSALKHLLTQRFSNQSLDSILFALNNERCQDEALIRAVRDLDVVYIQHKQAVKRLLAKCPVSEKNDPQ